MKFVCPVCKTIGDIPEEVAVPPTTQTTCQECGSNLSIEHDTGRVQVLKEKGRLPAGADAPGLRSKDEPSPIWSAGGPEKGRKDYLAIGVFTAVLGALIAIGIVLSLNVKRDALNQPLQMLSQLVDEVSQYGKSVLEEIQKKWRPQNKQTRQAGRYLRKGYDHYKANRLKKALKELNRAIEINPKNAEAYFWRARTFIRMEQFDPALADLKAVVDLNPRYSPAYDNLGWLFMRRNKLNESLANLDKSIELKPDNGWAHYLRGRVFFNKGDFRRAFENASTACKLGYKDGCRDARRYEAKLTHNG